MLSYSLFFEAPPSFPIGGGGGGCYLRKMTTDYIIFLVGRPKLDEAGHPPHHNTSFPGDAQRYFRDAERETDDTFMDLICSSFVIFCYIEFFFFFFFSSFLLQLAYRDLFVFCARGEGIGLDWIGVAFEISFSLWKFFFLLQVL